MIYRLIRMLQAEGINFPGMRLMDYISFRTIISIIFAMVFGLYIAPRIIHRLQRKQIGEEIRNLGLEGQLKKEGTPTMGGIIILLSITVTALLFSDLKNVYVILLLITTICLGSIGFLDDYLKIVKKDKVGLKGKYKIYGQIAVGLIVGLTLCLSGDVTVKQKEYTKTFSEATGTQSKNEGDTYVNVKSTVTTIPFIKNNHFDYAWLSPFKGKARQYGGWVIYILVIIFIITAVSNGTNLTDGMDGLSAGVSAIVGTAIGVLAYLSGNAIYSSYLNICFIPNSGEVVIFLAALVGALISFLWYNTYPAQVFMGDTGSLAIGGILAVAAIVVRTELLLPVLCGIFFMESLSVIIQRLYFKYTKRKYGKGVRIFKMSPLHHHFQIGESEAIIKKPRNPIPEAKIVVRFWITAIILCVIAIITLKIR
ncbi:MAG: phospho-N-acetylmuramoyl-pentapeptide-transferase [Bacteroidales bacterium]|jgi:phospho-N-acetylmuramoyl-pentapeptide-transferase|nr:phospho-N-acetylmuramoyl-pentapeptide-transferase [Bacteroidales bacterium]